MQSKIKKTKVLQVEVIQVVGLVIEAQVQGVAVGELCKLMITKEEFVLQRWLLKMKEFY